MKKEINPEALGFRRDAREKDLFVCNRCESRYGFLPKEPCDCALPIVEGKRLYLHDSPEQWPYASKGQSLVTIPALANFINGLSPEYSDELATRLNWKKP